MSAGSDFVLWALLLVAVVLWNALQGILRRRRRFGHLEGPEAPPVQVPWGRQPEAQTVREHWGRAPSEEVVSLPAEVAEHAAREAARVARQQATPRHTGRTKRWRTRAEVQRAFVDAAVLGPPRALEPWHGGDEPAGRGAPRRS